MLAILAVTFILLAAVAQASSVVELTSESFEHQTQASTGQTTGKWFVKFYAPWCGHCKKLTPIWDELSDVESLKQDFLVAKVDCTQHKDICQRFGIRSYPTLKLFANRQVYDYNGGRTLDELKSFLEGSSFGEGKGVPKPPSWLESQMTQNPILKELVDDYDHIVSYRKNAAAILIAIGVVLGVALFWMLGLIFGGSRKINKRKTE